jgi:hypothetical protein
MNPKMRRNLSGAFLVQDLGQGSWRLTRTALPTIDVFLQGADSDAAETLGLSTVNNVGIEWRAEAVLLTVTAADRLRTVRAHIAIVHEPLAHLYEKLPLEKFDTAARRFWRRVFRVVRIPGGRYLLRILARRTSDRH